MKLVGVIITTRHNLHASQVIKALESGKHVFVEKPLALSLEELNKIENLYCKSNNSITVGQSSLLVYSRGKKNYR